MRVTSLMKSLIAIFSILACINIALAVLSNRSREMLFYGYDLSNEFKSATYDSSTWSMLLTRNVRSFVTLSHIEAETNNNYMAYINLLEQATIDRAAELFAQKNAKADDLQLILRARELSDSLRALEKTALDAVLDGESVRAIEILLSSEVYDLTYSLETTLDDLQKSITAFTHEQLESAGTVFTIHFYMRVIVTLLFAFASIFGTFILLRMVQNAIHEMRKTTRIRENEERLREAAEEESRAKTQFLARMSHEIRTPMNAVLGITEIELMKPNPSQETFEAFSRIHRSSKLLLTVINDILDLSKVEAGKMEVVVAEYDTATLIMDTVNLNLMHKAEKPIEFILNVNENIPKTLIGDEHRIKQILNNFLSNAFKYTAEGTVKMSVGKVSTSEKNKLDIVFNIEDTGQGMSPEQISNLFESAFTRFNIKENRAIEGTGLGLSIAHQLISMMDGSVSVKSVVGEGTFFTIRIPQAVSTNETIGAEAAQNLYNMKNERAAPSLMPVLEYEPLPHGRVLVVDDIETNLYVIEGYLEPYKIVPETVRSGEEAIERVRAGNTYDIIFMDHMMPEMDGLEATKILRGMGYQKPIIALTANIIKGTQELLLSNGFSGFLPKPIDAVQLNDFLLANITKAKKLNPKIAGAFVRDAKNAINIMQSYLQGNETLRSFAIQAHGLKSSLANISKPVDLAARLETAANADDTELIMAQAPAFISFLTSIINELEPPAAAEATADSDPELLSSTLEAIFRAADRYDKKNIRNALVVLSKETWSRETGELIAEIETRLLHSDFEGIVELGVVRPPTPDYSSSAP
ncbi:MAG: ATP-binding protein [Defluviitaleaceae bacterium]|nr:ATP-binding protein [Defluviitaleaceae bacterium]